MTNQTNGIPFFIYTLLFLLSLFLTHTTTQRSIFAGAGKRTIHIPDELDDVVDDEEDDDWKIWGKKKPGPSTQPGIPPPDFDKMDMSQIQAEMMKSQTGPVFGFVKLKLGVQRTPDAVSEIAMKWTKVSKTGGIEVKFMGVDRNTIMITMERGQDKEELKDFILDQSDAYEVKMGDQIYRRPGDPPLEEVIERLHQEKEVDHDEHKKEEL